MPTDGRGGGPIFPRPAPDARARADPAQVDPKKLLKMDAKDVVQKAQQEMQHLKRHFLVVVLTDPEEPPKKVALTLALAS